MDPVQKTKLPTRSLMGLIAVFVLLAGSVSIFNPFFEASDEIRHYRYVRILVTEHRLPVQGQEAARAQSHHPPLYYALSALLSGWIPSPHDGTYQHPGNPFWGYRNWAIGIDNKLQYWHGPSERFPFQEGFWAVIAARWVNILLGAATVAVTYHLARRVLNRQSKDRRTDSPNQKDYTASTGATASNDRVTLWPQSPPTARRNPTEPLAVAAAAIVALNPQFIYQSAAINNDIIATLCGTALLLMCAIILQDGIGLRRLVELGIVAGLALLSKLQVAAIGPAVALSLILASRPQAGESRHRRSHWISNGLRAILIVGAITTAVCGWWYLRNLRLYGDFTGMTQLDAMWGGREAGDNLWAIQQGLPQLWASLWGRFGYGQIPIPSAMTTAMMLFSAISLAGLLNRRRSQIGAREQTVLGTAIIGVAITVAYYMARQPAGAMGRFLFPVLPAFAILLVAGLDAWLNSPQQTNAAITAGMGLFTIVALVGYLWSAVTYPPRKILPVDPASPSHQAQVGDVARILSATVDQEEVAPGDAVLVRVNWEPLRWTEEPLTVFVHLTDEAGVVVAQRDTWPGLSRAATTSWRAGVPFVDTYRVDLPETLYSPNTLTVSVGLYGSTVGRVPIVVDDPSVSTEARDSLELGTLTVVRQDAAWANPINVNFDDQIHLVGYEITPRALTAGETFTITLTWDVRIAPEATPHIFAQVLDPDWNVWGSNDGGHPEWHTGIVTETRQITLIPETPAGSYPVNVGLIADGKRLRIIADNGTLLGDYVSLGPVGIH